MHLIIIFAILFSGRSVFSIYLDTPSITMPIDHDTIVSISKRCMGFNMMTKSRCSIMCVRDVSVQDLDEPQPFAYCGHHHPVRRLERKQQREKRRKLEEEVVITFGVCSICHQDVKDAETHIKTSPCGHIFHKDCINRWLCENCTCPNCRRTVEQLNYSIVQ